MTSPASECEIQRAVYVDWLSRWWSGRSQGVVEGIGTRVGYVKRKRKPSRSEVVVEWVMYWIVEAWEGRSSFSTLDQDTAKTTGALRGLGDFPKASQPGRPCHAGATIPHRT